LPVKDYLQRMGERATVQRVNADRKANTGLMLARRSAK
jgi:glutathione S-transferase